MALQHTSKPFVSVIVRTMRKVTTTYWLVYVTEEFLGRELRQVELRQVEHYSRAVKSRGCRNDCAAINQLCDEASSVTRTWVNRDNISNTNVFILGLAQEAHFEEGLSEWIDHQRLVNWKSIRLDDYQCTKRLGMMTHVRRIARCMPCVGREPTAKKNL